MSRKSQQPIVTGAPRFHTPTGLYKYTGKYGRFGSREQNELSEQLLANIRSARGAVTLITFEEAYLLKTMNRHPTTVFIPANFADDQNDDDRFNFEQSAWGIRPEIKLDKILRCWEEDFTSNCVVPLRIQAGYKGDVKVVYPTNIDEVNTSIDILHGGIEASTFIESPDLYERKLVGILYVGRPLKLD